MNPPSDRPPYAPPKYLTTGPILTAEQLVSEYEEFSNNLRYITIAPELVFERLVTSLRDTFHAALELERKQHETSLREYADEMKRKDLEVNKLEDTNGVVRKGQSEGEDSEGKGKDKDKGKGKEITVEKKAKKDQDISPAGRAESRNSVVGNFALRDNRFDVNAISHPFFRDSKW